jgi:hypothetical protein
VPSLQLIQKFKLRIIKNVKVLLALHKLHTQVNIFGFTFLDLLIKFMKMRLLYILYCPPPPPLQRDDKDLLIPWPFYMCRFTGPPPPILSSYWLAHLPITQSGFGCRGERGETGITPAHARWQRAQKILVLVTLMPHMENGQG